MFVQAITRENEDGLAPLLRSIAMNPEEGALAMNTQARETEKIGLGASVLLPQTSIATFPARIADLRSPRSTPFRIPPSFHTRSDSPTLVNGGE